MEEIALIFMLIGLGFVLLAAAFILFFVYQRTRRRRIHMEGKSGVVNHHFDLQSRYSRNNSADFIRTRSPDPISSISTTHHIHIGAAQSRPTFEVPPVHSLPSPPSSSGSTAIAERDTTDTASNAKSAGTNGSLRSVVMVGVEDEEGPIVAELTETPVIPSSIETTVVRPQTAPNARDRIEMPEVKVERPRTTDNRRATIPSDLRLPSRMEKLPENDNEQLYAEYEQLECQPIHKDQTAGLSQPNMRRNRYHDVVPYDENRVILRNRPCDYINASYIRNVETGKVNYIAAQAPLAENEALGRNREETVTDFWHMIWQEQINCIVNLTQCVEDMRSKSARYWPENVGEDERIDDLLSMNMVETIEHDDICFQREIWLEKKGEGTRKITQWQFKQWKDASAPTNQEHLLAFIEKIRESKKHPPILVHCSAGVGRTGVFIALNELLDKLEAHSIIDIYEVVSRLRHERSNTVQSFEQYASIYELVAMAIRKRARANG
ncbi:hypothetical protein M3Y96_00045800 [Aphelenchoides besseyi]|nr:hypothetical protein M3Y96_00045800 [Aphelenchoides besseyi]